MTHAIPGFHCLTPDGIAYKMHLLYGSVARQADVIRQQMCQAKIEMLLEVLHHPESPFYLGYYDHDYDYVTPIRNAISAINRYPLV